MPSVASQVNASINQHRDAKASTSANGKERNASSPFEEMLDSAVAAEEPAPSKKDPAPAKASRGNGTTAGKQTKSAHETPATDDATRAQSTDLERDEAARGESAEDIDAIVTDLVSKALAADAGDGAVQPPETVEQAAPVEKSIADIGLAAFREAVTAAALPQPEAEPAKDEPQTTEAEADVKADADASAGAATGPVKADAIAAAVVTMAAEVVADPGQSDAAASMSGPKLAPAVEASAALPETAAPSVEHEGPPAAAEAADEEAALAPQIEAPKPHKQRLETTAQRSETSELQPDGSGVAKGETAPVKPAPAHHLSHAAHHRAETADAKPAKAGVNAAETPAPTKTVDAPQTLQTLPQMSAPTVGTAQAPSVQKDVAPTAAAVPIEGVAVEIAAKASEGKHSFEIRLDPPELGRIHVRLDVDRNGELTSRVVADRQDTLDLLRREAPQLERALNDAGLRTSNNGLQFSLRDQGQGQQQQQQQALAQAARLIIPDEHLAAELTQRGYYQPAGSAGGIDIRV